MEVTLGAQGRPGVGTIPNSRSTRQAAPRESVNCETLNRMRHHVRRPAAPPTREAAACTIAASGQPASISSAMVNTVVVAASRFVCCNRIRGLSSPRKTRQTVINRAGMACLVGPEPRQFKINSAARMVIPAALTEATKAYRRPGSAFGP